MFNKNITVDLHRKKIITIDVDIGKTYKQTNPISGGGMFFARRQDTIPTYIAKTMFQNNIIYERNIIATVKTMSEPHGISSELEVIQEGIELLNIKVGYIFDNSNKYMKKYQKQSPIECGNWDKLISEKIIWEE